MKTKQFEIKLSSKMKIDSFLKELTLIKETLEKEEFKNISVYVESTDSTFYIEGTKKLTKNELIDLDLIFIKSLPESINSFRSEIIKEIRLFKSEISKKSSAYDLVEINNKIKSRIEDLNKIDSLKVFIDSNSQEELLKKINYIKLVLNKITLENL